MRILYWAIAAVTWLLCTVQAQAAAEHIAYGKEASQFGELTLPDGKPPFKVIVMIHGGCWQMPYDLRLMNGLTEDMRKSGFAVWNLEYRRLGETGGGYPGTFLDIAAGMDKLRELRAPDKLDLSHVTVIGHSAGGHLAFWAAARSHLSHASALYTSHPLSVEKAVSLAGVLDFADYAQNNRSGACGPNVIARLTGADKRSSPYADTSPAGLLPLDVPQIVVSGGRDTIVASAFASHYAGIAQKAGDKVELLEIKDADHFDLINPASPAWKQVKALLVH